MAAIAAVLLLGLGLYREMRLPDIWRALLSSAQTTGAILFLVAAAGLYAWVAAWEGLPATVSGWLVGLSDNPLVFLGLVNLLLLGMGMISDPLPCLILVVPVLLPVASDVYGIDPVHFGLIACINLTVGLLTPPVGVGLFTAAMQNDVPSDRLARLVLPYLAGVLGVLGILVLWPDLALGLVRSLR